MKATLIYNPNAGAIGQVTSEALQEALRSVGYDAIYKATNNEADLDAALEGTEGLVVVAGGDGTVRAVATRLIDRLNVALSILPLGTANNISSTLGINGSPLDIIARLDKPCERPFDVGFVRSPWGKDNFMEGAGYGFFAEALAIYAPEEGKSVLRGLAAFTKTLAVNPARRYQMKLDGQDISDSYVLVEALNTPAIGPRLKMAPDANPADGLLEVIRVYEAERQALLRYLGSILNETPEELPYVDCIRGRKLEIMWDGFLIHVDGEVRPLQNEAESTNLMTNGVITIELIPQAIQFWLPRMEPPPEPEPSTKE